MAVDHDVVLGGFLKDILVVVDHPLAVVVLSVWEDIANIACLHCIVTILVHEGECCWKVTLIIACRA